VPERFCLVFEKAMAKDPGARYESTALFGRALQEAQASENVTVTPLEVQGIDPTVTPGVGAPRAADPTISVPNPANTAPPVASAPPAATPPPVAPYPTGTAPAAATSPAPPAATGSTYPATPAYPSGSYPAASADSVSMPAYGSGTTTVDSSSGNRLALILGLVAVVVFGGLIALLVLGGGDDEGPQAGPTTTATAGTSEPGTATTDPGTVPPSGPTTLAPGSVGPSGLVVTAIPFGLGDNEDLDQLAADCAAGDLESCDTLYDDSPLGSRFEDFGATCGARVEFDPNTPCPNNELISS
jgi:hypothetical protein